MKMLIDDCVPVSPFRGPIVCIAAGPSVTSQQIWAISVARARDEIRVVAVNDAVYLAWFADVLHGCDANWWGLDRNKGLDTFPGYKTSLEAHAGVKTLRNTGTKGFDPAPGAIRSGGNGGYQAAHLAAKIWRATSIILVGYDYSEGGARDHFWGRYEGAMDKTSNVLQWRACLKELTDELESRKIRVLNATVQSTIDWLPRFDLSKANWADL